MKKLMIAAAIVCAAAMSHAAAMDWWAFGIMDSEDTGLFSGSAILTVWNETTGASTTYNGAVVNGDIMELVGDGSSATAGFIQQDVTYSAQFTMADGGSVYTSEKLTGVMGMYPSQNNFMFMSGSWSAVPEPTSGLLLLIGVAGLALKRKRA